MSKIINAVPELLGAIGSGNEEAVKAFAAGSSIDFITVHNSDKEVHLALPYYEEVDNKASAMTDNDLAGASGGFAETTLSGLVYGIQDHAVISKSISAEWKKGSFDKNVYYGLVRDNNKAWSDHSMGAETYYGEPAPSGGGGGK